MRRHFYYKKVGLQGVHAIRSWVVGETRCHVGFWPLSNDVWKLSNRPAFDDDPCPQCKEEVEKDA